MEGRPRQFYCLSILCACAALALIAAFILAAAAAPAGESDRVHWKPMDGAQLKLDGKTPIAWNVYEPERKDKKKDPPRVLVLLGRRYLLIDVKEHLVYSVLPADLEAQGTDFESGDLGQESRLIPSTEWSTRDVGPMELVELKLGDYGRVLQIQLPHMPDMRPFY